MPELPSLLVFGPQTNLPSHEVLAEFRKDLIANPQVDGLLNAIKDLPAFWQTLTEFDPSLRQIQGAELLGGLSQWIKNGVFPQNLSSLPNVSALPLTVMMQVLLYLRYLDKLQIKQPHRQVLEHIQAGGIQGFCVGFLAALVVSCSENENGIAELGTAAIRLAVCVGAYVDQDALLGIPPNQTSCIAVRWRADFEENEVVKITQSYSNVRRPSTLKICRANNLQ